MLEKKRHSPSRIKLKSSVYVALNELALLKNSIEWTKVIFIMESPTAPHIPNTACTNRVITDSHTGPIEEHPLVLYALTRFRARIVPAIPGENEVVSSPDSINLPVAPLTVRRLQAHQAQEAASLLEWGNPFPRKPGEPIFGEKSGETDSQPLLLPIVPPPSPAQKTSEPFVESPLAESGDPLVHFLENLTEEYDTEGNITDRDLARNIRVHTDYIVIDGIRIKRENEEMDDRTRRNAQVRYGTVVFPFDTVKNFFWEDLPTEEEWQKIIDAIPGKNDAEKRENAEQILGIVYTETVHTAGELLEAFFWIKAYSGPQDQKKIPKKIGRRAIISKANHTKCFSFKNSGDVTKVCYSVRLLVRPK